MAEAVQKRANRYNSPGATYGNVAYDMSYAGTKPLPRERDGGAVLRPRPRVRERALSRPVVQVREAGRVSLFAVAGFLAVGVFAVLVLMSYVRLTVLADSAAQLSGQLTQLETEHKKLLAQYELAYDLSAVEARVTADGSMIKPDPSQIFTLDLSQPDDVVRYGEQAAPAAEGGDLWSKLTAFFWGALEYFR